jgi:hypothetical protein
MEFDSPNALQEFLARWLEEHGHSVHRHVSYNDNRDIDILTQAYTIECQPVLDSTGLWTAADELQSCHSYFPDQKPVIAGLSTVESEEIYQTVEQIKKSGIEIWFVDQMPTFLEYYNYLNAHNLLQEDGVTPSQVNRRSPLAGCFISLGMAAILTLSFWIAYRILDRHQIQSATRTQQGQAWENLHDAVSVWDLDTARVHLKTLENSRNNCVATFAERFDDSLERRGADGFRDINPIKRALNQEQGCDLDLRDYDFSP